MYFFAADHITGNDINRLWCILFLVDLGTVLKISEVTEGAEAGLGCLGNSFVLNAAHVRLVVVAKGRLEERPARGVRKGRLRKNYNYLCHTQAPRKQESIPSFFTSFFEVWLRRKSVY